MKTKTKTASILTIITLAAFLSGCGEKKPATSISVPEYKEPVAVAGEKPAMGDSHDDHGHGDHDHDHEHDEVPLGTFTAGDMQIEAAQSHGNLEAGKEGHLVIKLPHNDAGATVVRAWIGTEDRTMSTVGRGEYAAAHNDYDIHAMAPNPLPENTKWWVEIEKPDGTKAIGSVAPKM